MKNLIFAVTCLLFSTQIFCGEFLKGNASLILKKDLTIAQGKGTKINSKKLSWVSCELLLHKQKEDVTLIATDTAPFKIRSNKQKVSSGYNDGSYMTDVGTVERTSSGGFSWSEANSKIVFAKNPYLKEINCRAWASRDEYRNVQAYTAKYLEELFENSFTIQEGKTTGFSK